jgi:hypothetical protein
MLVLKISNLQNQIERYFEIKAHAEIIRNMRTYISLHAKLIPIEGCTRKC